MKWHPPSGKSIWGEFGHVPKQSGSRGCLLGTTNPDNNPLSPEMPKRASVLCPQKSPSPAPYSEIGAQFPA